MAISLGDASKKTKISGRQGLPPKQRVRSFGGVRPSDLDSANLGVNCVGSGVELDAKPGVELDAKPGVERDAKPGVELDAKPGVELDAKPVEKPLGNSDLVSLSVEKLRVMRCIVALIEENGGQESVRVRTEEIASLIGRGRPSTKKNLFVLRVHHRAFSTDAKTSPNGVIYKMTEQQIAQIKFLEKKSKKSREKIRHLFM